MVTKRQLHGRSHVSSDESTFTVFNCSEKIPHTAKALMFSLLAGLEGTPLPYGHVWNMLR